MVMEAPGTAAPLESVITPLTEPKIACANVREGTSVIRVLSNSNSMCRVDLAAGLAVVTETGVMKLLLRMVSCSILGTCCQSPIVRVRYTASADGGSNRVEL